MIRIFCPLPPSKSGIASYLHNLLPHMSSEIEIEVICEDATQAQNSAFPKNVSARCYREFRANTDTSIGTQNLYHLGNNIHHSYVYHEFMKSPGIAVLHDLSLHHLITSQTLKFGQKYRYLALMEEDAGEIGRYFAYQRDKGQGSERLEFTIKLIRQIVKRATAVITHSKWGLAYIRSLGIPTNVYHINHYSMHPKQIGLGGITREEARRMLGLDPGKFIIVAPGFATPPKKINWLIDALEIAKNDIRDFELIVAGELNDSALAMKIRKSSFSQNIKLTGYLDNKNFYLNLIAADLVSVLRYPSAGESSGVVMQAFGIGRCSLVIDYMAFSDFPADVVVRVPLSKNIKFEIANHIVNLAQNPNEKRRVELACLKYARSYLTTAICASSYKNVLEKYDAQPRKTSWIEEQDAGKGVLGSQNYIELTHLDKFQPVLIRPEEIVSIETARPQDGGYTIVRLRSGLHFPVTQSFKHIALITKK